MPFSIRPYRRFPVHSARMIKQVFVGCVLVVGLTNCMQEVKTGKIHANCPEIPATTFAAVGLDAKAGALKFGELVSVGEFRTKTTPELLSAISQSVRDDQITDALICAAKERGELKNDEQIAHAWKVARFYRTGPTPPEAMEFHKQNPFPATLGKSLKPAPDAGAVAPLNWAITCGPSPDATRTPEQFFPFWAARVEEYRHRNKQVQDLEHLTEFNPPREAPPHPVQWHHEATYTLRCLEKIGKLKIEMVDPPRNKYRGEFENLKFAFLK